MELIGDIKDRIFKIKNGISDKYKIQVIQYVLLYYLNDQKDINYAYDLYQQIPDSFDKEKIFASIVKLKIWRSNENFRKEVVQNVHDAIKVAVKNNILDVNLIMELYAHITDNTYKKVFFADVISALSESDNIEIKLQSLSIAKKLIAEGADVNATATVTSYTPLFSAVRMNNIALVELLIERGALINDIVFVKDYRTPWKSTALEWAITAKNEEMVTILLKNGANPNLSTNSSNDDVRNTPIGRALVNRDYNIVELLLKNGANSNVRIGVFGHPLFFIISQMNANAMRFVQLFINYGINVNFINKMSAPLDVAYMRAWSPASPDHDKIIKILKDAGAKTGAELLQEKANKVNQMATE